MNGGPSLNERACTCHPTDRPPICQHRYAATECQDAYRAYKATRVTVSCLCGTLGCNAQACNPTTFKLALASVEIRDLRAALAGTRSADETSTTLNESAHCKTCECIQANEIQEYTLEHALRIARLWRGGKLIGGDEDAVIFALLAEVERVQSPKEPT